MVVYLVRHAEAVDKGATVADEWRHLTPAGRTESAAVAKEIHGLGARPRLILTSPLTRAVQTAEIMASRGRRKLRVEVCTLLMPGEAPEAVVEYLATVEGPGPVMLVGHEPQLGAVAAQLLGLKEAVTLKKGSCLALEKANKEGQAEFLWYLKPGKQAVMSLGKAFKG